MESIRFEIEPFGIRTTIVEPGFFRTDLLEAASTIWAELSIDDYAERTAQTRPAWQARSGRQSNDPAKLAKALVKLVDSGQPPRPVGIPQVRRRFAGEGLTQRGDALTSGAMRFPNEKDSTP